MPQQPICILNIVLPEEIIPEPDLPDHDMHKHSYITHTSKEILLNFILYNNNT